MWFFHILELVQSQELELYDTQSYEKTKQDAIAGALNEKKKQDVNFVNFPGFHSKELTELPGQLETPQLLHRITKAQHFNVRKTLATLESQFDHFISQHRDINFAKSRSSNSKVLDFVSYATIVSRCTFTTLHFSEIQLW